MTTERKPSSVGEILRHEFFEPMNIDQREFAQLCGIANPATIEWLLHDTIYFHRNHAERLAHCTGTTPEFWLNIHQAWRKWHLKQIHASISGTVLPEWAKSVYIHDREIIVSNGFPGGESRCDVIGGPIDATPGTSLSLCFPVVDGRVVEQ